MAAHAVITKAARVTTVARYSIFRRTEQLEPGGRQLMRQGAGWHSIALWTTPNHSDVTANYCSHGWVNCISSRPQTIPIVLYCTK